MSHFYPPQVYRRVLGALDREMRKVDSSVPWRQHLAGLVRRVRREEMDCVDPEFIAALQAARNALPENPVFRFTVSRFVLEIGEVRGADLWDREYEGRDREIRNRLGIDPDDDFPPGEGPPELDALYSDHERKADALIVSAFREFGEHAAADLFERDMDAFFAQTEADRKAVFGES